MKRRATLKDVARAAGVHLSTVSRALNPRTRHLLTPAVVERIREISRDLDYRPNAAAHSLRTNRTRTIGVVVPDITNPVFPPIIRGIEDALAKRSYVAILANTDGRLDQEAEIADLLRARGVDGLVLASVERQDKAVSRLFAEGLPIVTANRRVEDQAVSSVVNDEDSGILDVLRHLVRLGHRTVANIAGPQAMSTGVARYRAFESHRRALALDDSPDLVEFAAGFNEEEGGARTEALLRRRSDFSALVCANDRLAIGAIDALRHHGLDCPRDISVTGYNDMPLVDRLSPALTTVRIQQYEVGFDAANMLVDLIDTPADERQPKHVVRPVELIVRASTAAPAKARDASTRNAPADNPRA
jgi:LacI family transcriptional regulator, galactose operon repressor